MTQDRPPDAPLARPSIQERAARRASVGGAPADRYGSLVRTLQGGRTPGEVSDAGFRVEWNPVVRTLLVIAVVALAGYLLAGFVRDRVRESTVDTWTGPAGATAVTSGQRLPGCQDVEGAYDDVLPTWIRYGGVVYVISDRGWAVFGEGRKDQTRQVETGYSLGVLRILLTPQWAQEASPQALLLIRPPAHVARVYARTACT